MPDTKIYTVYFGQHRVAFSSEVPADADSVVYADKEGAVSRAKVIKKVETNKFISIIAKNPCVAFDHFGNEFARVEAAGGAVLNDRGELLMISLRERWDLPKGHIEAGETAVEAALREVEEETGIVAELVGEEPLAETWHAYDTYGRWELKRTRWWQMRAVAGTPRCQTEEGIASAVWCNRAERTEKLKHSYPTIKTVVEALEEKEREKSKRY